MNILGCDHSWDIESASFCPPLASVKIGAGGCGADLFLRLTAGFTTVYLRCGNCRDLKERIVSGWYEPQEKP